MVEPVAGREDGLRRLVLVARRAGGEVRQVRDDQVEVVRDALEQVAVHEVHLRAEAVGVPRRERAARCAHVSVAHTSTVGARSASVIAIAPEPVPMSAIRAGPRPIRSSAASTSFSVVGARREDPSGVGDEGESVEACGHRHQVQRSPMDWIPFVREAAIAVRRAARRARRAFARPERECGLRRRRSRC